MTKGQKRSDSFRMTKGTKAVRFFTNDALRFSERVTWSHPLTFPRHSVLDDTVSVFVCLRMTKGVKKHE